MSKYICTSCGTISDPDNSIWQCDCDADVELIEQEYGMYGIRVRDQILSADGELRRPEDCDNPRRFDSAIGAALWMVEHDISGGEWVLIK